MRSFSQHALGDRLSELKATPYPPSLLDLLPEWRNSALR